MPNLSAYNSVIQTVNWKEVFEAKNFDGHVYLSNEIIRSTPYSFIRNKIIASYDKDLP